MKRAAIPAAVTAFAVSLVFGTPEVITMLITFFVLFAVIFTVLFIFLRIPIVATWSAGRQRVATWLVAVGTGACVGFLPLTIRFLTQ